MRRARLLVVAGVACALMLAFAGSALAASSTTSYTATETIPVPPASDYAGSGGGDGWAVALSSTQVFNVFHHQEQMTVACHLQADATPCWSPETITDGSGDNFATSGHPGLYLDQSTGKLYVYGTRTSDDTAGVVCIDTTQAATNTDPFCGFTALSPVGAATNNSLSAISGPALVGSHWYAFNFYSGQGAGGGKNELLCFDVSTDAACANQPFDLNLGSGNDGDTNYPPPAVAAIGSQVIVPATIDGSQELACFDDSTQSVCSGTWPTPLSFSYVSSYGAPFPLLGSTGGLQGFCLPTGTDQCFGLNGASVATPAGLASVVPNTSGWNGPAFVLGPRVYVPNGNTEVVECFDYSTGAACANFPKTLSNLGLLYTVNPDPQRPTCIWVNADDGSQQIQSFDAFSGAACGQGTIRTLASQFVVPKPACTPASYTALQILSPAPGTYTSGTVSFEDTDGNSIAGAPDETLDNTGTVSLTGLGLNTALGLPQFLLNLSGVQGTIGQVQVKLTWTATYDPSCIGPNATAVAPAVTSTPPSGSRPALSGKPALSGHTVAGSKLSCSKGAWTGNPSSYTYHWYRNLTPLATATGPTYVLTKLDQGSKLTCVVTAINAYGSASGTSNSLGIPVPKIPRCPAATGRMTGRNIGLAKLGINRSQARQLFSHHSGRGRQFEDFFCLTPIGVRVGYASPLLLKTLTAKEQRELKGKVVWASTSNPHYSLDRIAAGASLAYAKRTLGGGRTFHIGHNYWYVVRKSSYTVVLKVRHGVVEEVGIADNLLTGTKHQEAVLMHSFY